jgi:hypothetical protein
MILSCQPERYSLIGFPNNIYMLRRVDTIRGLCIVHVEKNDTIYKMVIADGALKSPLSIDERYEISCRSLNPPSTMKIVDSKGVKHTIDPSNVWGVTAIGYHDTYIEFDQVPGIRWDIFEISNMTKVYN